MATVVLLRGVNVGGHRTFRPSALATQLSALDVVNIGAAGTFVVRKRVARTTLEAEFRKRLQFETEVILVNGKDVLDLVAADPFAGRSSRRDIVPFVTVLAKRTAPPAGMPRSYPPGQPWQLTILGHSGQFVLGLYRRQMKAISWLGKLEKALGVPSTTRNWNTIQTIARMLPGPA